MSDLAEKRAAYQTWATSDAGSEEDAHVYVEALEAEVERQAELLAWWDKRAAWWDKRAAWYQSRIPDPDDLRLVLRYVEKRSPDDEDLWAALDRVRATLEVKHE
jgi:hypothetical protein